jgi:hypothetical protein
MAPQLRLDAFRLGVLSLSLLAAGCGAEHKSGGTPPPSGQGGGPGDGGQLTEGTQRLLELQPRLQWRNNYGYCGEASLIAAGLYFGQYVSQFDARAIASDNANQSEENSQLLLGVNDTTAAAAMRLKVTSYQQPAKPDAKGFLTWVRSAVARGSPVAIGIYMNETRFYGSKDPNAGDGEYDHIVPVTGVTSNAAWGDSAYHGDDILQFSDNGLWDKPSPPTYAFTTRFDDFLGSRTEANAANAPVYSLTDQGANYGLAVAGVLDDDGVLLPVRAATDPNSEPAIADGSNQRPEPTALNLTVTVSGLTPGVAYKLYRYDDFGEVPSARFNALADKAAEAQNIQIHSGSTFTTTRRIQSNEMAIYRAVPATAP